MKGQHFLPKQLTSDSHRPSVEVLTANSEIVNKRAKLRHHYLVLSAKVTILMMCDKFTTLTKRKQILSQQRRCFICLKGGHVLKDCPSFSEEGMLSTVVEKGYHNRCLYPQKFPRQETDALLVTETRSNHLLRIMLIPLVSADESMGL